MDIHESGSAVSVLISPPIQGVAEAELEENVSRTLNTMIRSTRKEVSYLHMWLWQAREGRSMISTA